MVTIAVDDEMRLAEHTAKLMRKIDPAGTHTAEQEHQKALAAVGADDVLIKMWNVWSVDTGKINCDYYDFLRLDMSATNNFRGEYMTQYSWAEMTTGNLMGIAETETGHGSENY